MSDMQRGVYLRILEINAKKIKEAAEAKQKRKEQAERKAEKKAKAVAAELNGNVMAEAVTTVSGAEAQEGSAGQLEEVELPKEGDEPKDVEEDQVEAVIQDEQANGNQEHQPEAVRKVLA